MLVVELEVELVVDMVVELMVELEVEVMEVEEDWGGGWEPQCLQVEEGEVEWEGEEC